VQIHNTAYSRYQNPYQSFPVSLRNLFYKHLSSSEDFFRNVYTFKITFIFIITTSAGLSSNIVEYYLQTTVIKIQQYALKLELNKGFVLHILLDYECKFRKNIRMLPLSLSESQLNRGLQSPADCDRRESCIYNRKKTLSYLFIG
jgi:hypothetical protein